jgi:hypothetical protein
MSEVALAWCHHPTSRLCCAGRYALLLKAIYWLHKRVHVTACSVAQFSCLFKFPNH